MRSVGLKVLKNKLSEYVRLASQGERVLIADRDRVVAELVPPEETRATRLPDAALAELIRTGLMTPAILPPDAAGAPPLDAQPVAPLSALLEELDRDRGR